MSEAAKQLARIAIARATEAILAEIDRGHGGESVEFQVHLHLNCIKYGEGRWYGEPMPYQLNHPLYQFASARS